MSLENLTENKPYSIERLPLALRIISSFERLLLYLSLLGIICISFINVLMRNTGLGGLVWADRILVILVLFIAILGSSIAAQEDKHITIDLAYNILPENTHRHLKYFSHLLSAVFAAVLTYFTVNMTIFEYRAGVQVIRGIGAWIPMAVMSFGFALITVRYFFHFLRSLSGSKSPKQK